MSESIKLLATSLSFVQKEDLKDSDGNTVIAAGTRAVLVPVTTTRAVMHGNHSLEDLWGTLSKVNHGHDVATENAPGFMSAADKTKLNSIVPGGSSTPMTGASDSAAGASGLVPAPAAGDQVLFLRGDGTWAAPTDTDTKVNVTLGTTTKAYLLGTSTTPTATATGVTAVADTNVYLDTAAGSLFATQFRSSQTSNNNSIYYNLFTDTALDQTVTTSANTARVLTCLRDTSARDTYLLTARTTSSNENIFQLDVRKNNQAWNAQLGVAIDGSGNKYAFAPTPAADSNDTKIATTAWVNSKGYLTAHQSLANYVALTGAQTITGFKTVRNALAFQNASITKGTNPTSNAVVQHLRFTDKDGTATSNAIGVVTSGILTNGTTLTGLYAYKYVSGSTAAVALAVYCDPDGTGYAVCPTPAANSNDTKIATTAWVRTYASTTDANPTLAWGTKSKVATVNGVDINVTMPANPNTNTDTLMTQNVSTTNATYPVLLCPTANATANQGAKTGIFAAAVKVNPSTGVLSATGFSGPLTGNVTGNCSGSSGSCTGNAATATTAGNVTGTVAIANGGTGATTRLNALKALTSENVGTSATYFLTITDSWGKGGYTSVANAKTVLGINATDANPTLAWGTKSKVATVNGVDINVTMPANPNTNTDTLVTQNVSTTNATYPLLLCPTANATANQGAKTSIFAKSVKINPSTNVISASGFSGPLTGNVTGNCSGSSGSCTGNAATATKLATARNLYVKLSTAYDSSSPVTFDGSAAKALPVNGTLPVGNGGTGSTTLDGAGIVTKTGTQTISGTKTFSANTVMSKSKPRYFMYNSGFTRGSTVSADTSAGLEFYDKDGTNFAGRVFQYAYTSGDTAIAMATAANTSAENIATFKMVLPSQSQTLKKVHVVCSASANAGGTKHALLGTGSNYWEEVWSPSFNEPSDERIKDDISAIPDTLLDAWEEVTPVQFKFKESIEYKGRDKSRFHTGYIAQWIRDKFQEKNVDPEAYGLYLYDFWPAQEEQRDENGNIVEAATEEHDTYGLRYIECLVVEAAYQRRRADRLEAAYKALEARVAALEAVK